MKVIYFGQEVFYEKGNDCLGDGAGFEKQDYIPHNIEIIEPNLKSHMQFQRLHHVRI